MEVITQKEYTSNKQNMKISEEDPQRMKENNQEMA